MNRASKTPSSVPTNRYERAREERESNRKKSNDQKLTS